MANQRYRGSAYRHKRKLFILLLVLALLALIATGVFFFLQEYIIFTSEGFRFSFSHPTPQTTQTQFTPSNQQLSTPSSIPSGQSVTPVTPPISPETTDKQPITSALLADVSRMNDEAYRASLLNALKERGISCVALSILGQDGMCYLPTDSVYAKNSNAVSPNAKALSGILAQLRAQDIRLIAIISVCKNNLTPRAYRSGAILTSGVTWLDHKYISWFNPYTKTVGAYLTDLLSSCKNEGFDQVILDNLSFPVDGKTDLIEYPEGQDTDRAAAIDALAQTAAQKADDLGLSLGLDAYSGNENISQTGQSISSLAKYFKVIYVSVNQESDPALTNLKAALQTSSCLPGAIFSKDVGAEDTLCSLIPFIPSK